MSLRDLLVALTVFGLLPFIFASPYIGVLVWSWLGYMNPHRLTWGFAYHFPWVELVAITTMLAFIINTKEKFRIPWNGTIACFLTLLLWTGVTTMFALSPASAQEQLEVFAKVMVLVFFTLLLVQTRERIHWLVWVIAISLGFYGVKGGIFVLVTGGRYHVYGPPQSFIANNNDLALALCMTIPLMRYLQLQATKKWVKVGLWWAMGLTAIAILGTYSRGGMLTLAAVLVMMFMKSRGKIVLAVVALIAIPLVLATVPQQWYERMDTISHYQQDESAVGRIQSWEFAFNTALHRPLVGGGFRSYENLNAWHRYAPPDSVDRAIHSIYFEMIGEQGFVGFALFMLLLLLSWRNIVFVRKRTVDLQQWRWAYDLASMLQVSGVAYAVGGAFAPQAYFDLSYQLLAIAALVRYRVEQEAPALARVETEGMGVSTGKQAAQGQA